jgi:hypothetical protein
MSFASVFFLGALVLMGMFARHITRDAVTIYTALLAILAILPIITGSIMLASTAALLFSKDAKWSAQDYGSASSAPKFMINPAAEWATILLLNVWVIAVSLHLLLG